VGRKRVFAGEMVEIVVAVARRGGLAPERALALVEDLPAGGITLRRGMYLWRVVLPCETDLVLRAIETMSQVGERLRNRLRSNGLGLEIHSNYAK